MTLTPATQQWLSAHARAALARALGLRGAVAEPGPPPDDAALRQPARVFVSWHVQGRLRGCIGTLAAHDALVDAVARYAVESGQHDPRMVPMTVDELVLASVEISVLGAPATLLDPGGAPVTGVDAIATCLRPHEHGVVLRLGARRAVFLPVVWESLPEPAAFLAALCRKAGIDPHGEGAQVQAELFEALRWDAPPLPATAPIARA
ncbi:MAG: AmmeMemoRadiSam system protein A [Nannocystaceae bacterium]|nr:AmmeMemoRadiSam system protein A [Nannocystaceae bacterium]